MKKGTWASSQSHLEVEHPEIVRGILCCRELRAGHIVVGLCGFVQLCLSRLHSRLEVRLL